MKLPAFLVFALLSAFALVSSVFGQKPKDEIIVMPSLKVESRPYSKTYENILRDLDKLFSPVPKMSEPIPADEIERTSLRHTIEDSPNEFFGFGLRAGDLKALKGGFTIAGAGFYFKSGVARHPDYNKYVTLTFGKRVTWGYQFRNEHDLFREAIRRPVERFNYVLENPFRTFLGFTIK